VFSSVSPPPLDLSGGGWNATFLPGCSGSCFPSASRRTFGSRENGILEGPTEFLAGSVIDTPPVRPLVVTEDTGTGVPEGDGARGRLSLFSDEDITKVL
jgi:hypothetical protein